jgi:hypothetical protein
MSVSFQLAGWWWYLTSPSGDEHRWVDAWFCSLCIFSSYVLWRYTVYTKVYGHPFKWVDSAMSATLVADWCIKSSTQPCHLHGQTLAVEWPVRGTVIGCYLSNKSVCKMFALLELPRPTVSAVIVKWKRLRATTAQPQSDRPQKLTERDQVQKRVARNNRLSSAATLTTKFQTAPGSNVSTITVRRVFHEIGYHGPSSRTQS